MRRNSARPFALGALACVAGLLGPGRAAAFCRTSVCNGQTAAVCTPPEQGDCGTPLFWSSPCVGFSMQKDVTPGISLETATQVLETAFATWMSANCSDGRHPRIAIHDLGPVECDRHEYNQDQGNANIILFRNDDWPYGGNATLALTTVTYNLDTGEIYDADMELNSAQATFTTGDVGIQFDLLSITTHEAGHFLGLAHTPVADATMNTNYKQGSIELRDLAPDDVAGICTIYPPGIVPDDCNPTPRHGFQSQCATGAETASGCCSVAPGAPSGDLSARAALGLGALLLFGRRARRRSPSRQPLAVPGRRG